MCLWDTVCWTPQVQPRRSPSHPVKIKTTVDGLLLLHSASRKHSHTCGANAAASGVFKTTKSPPTHTHTPHTVSRAKKGFEVEPEKITSWLHSVQRALFNPESSWSAPQTEADSCSKKGKHLYIYIYIYICTYKKLKAILTPRLPSLRAFASISYPL